LGLLHPQTHRPLEWDEHYAPYLARAGAGFLGLARAINVGLLDMDGPLLTTFVDKWHPETHTFHLPSGEITVLMQDIGYILGLRLDGPAVTGRVEPLNWKDMVVQFTGHRPPDLEEGKNENKTSGVRSAWLRQCFNMCPPPAPKDIIERHTCVWLWHMVA
jgi:hypothetical protein